MSLQATGDGLVGTRHGVSPPHGVSPLHAASQKQSTSPLYATSPQNSSSPQPVLSQNEATNLEPTPLTLCVSQPASRFGKPIAGSVSVIINQFKASLKRWCNQHGHGYFQWQSRFYDHIIRNEESCQNIVNYMINNPKKWEQDKFHLK
jgi:hypothetical protein